jgi:hypothetical protein
MEGLLHILLEGHLAFQYIRTLFHGYMLGTWVTDGGVSNSYLLLIIEHYIINGR